MFLELQPDEQRKSYSQLLKAVGSFSGLFAESVEPYLAYRAAENIFCKAFSARNHSRSDVSVDASKDGVGIGIKTFVKKNGATMEKVAEFNKDQSYRQLEPVALINKIAEMRNERLETTKRILKLDQLVYHCVVREPANILVYETPMSLIDVATIRDVTVTASKEGVTKSIHFFDGSGEYTFNISKSTLYKRFNAADILLKVSVRIIEDPYAEIEKLLAGTGIIFSSIKERPHVFLPLYSTKGGEKYVPDKSGPNQWNAKPRFERKSGIHRPRNPDEFYVQIPIWIHRKFPNFFPDKDHPFELTLPDRSTMSAKVCQENSKALMSNPNSALGKWMLRDVMNLQERELLTYEKLETIGLDTVVVYKIDSDHYDIDFTKIGSYEKFLAENSEGEVEEEAQEDEEE